MCVCVRVRVIWEGVEEKETDVESSFEVDSLDKRAFLFLEQFSFPHEHPWSAEIFSVCVRVDTCVACVYI